MTLNGVMAVNEFGKPAFQLRTTCSSIELIDQKSASITHRKVKLVCVTKFGGGREANSISRYLLLIYCLSFTFHNVLTFGFWCSRSNYHRGSTD